MMKLNSGERIPLEKYIERIFAEREVARIEAAKVLQVHLDNLNHWKEETLREREKLVSRELYNSEHERLVGRVKDVEDRQSRLVGIGMILIVLAGIVGAFSSHILK